MLNVMHRTIGLDLGATNLKWAVVDGSGSEWRVVARDQVPTRTGEGPDGVVAQLLEIARERMTDVPGATAVGVGIPGRIDPARGLTRFLVNIAGDWSAVPVGPRLSAGLGLPAALINDARAFGLAELRLGAGRGASAMVGLTLGTGIGGVIAIGGRVHLGHDGSAGELGHQTIDPDGPMCQCGNRGCLEAFTRAERIAAACGTETAEEAVERARRGDAAALAGLERIGRYLGIGIANMITVVTPDRVVIGGGIAAAGDLLLGPIRSEVEQRVTMTSLSDVEIVTAELGTWAGAIGAAIHGAKPGD